MSTVGIFLVMCAGLLLLLGAIRFLAWLTELQNEHGSLGGAVVHTVKRYAAPRVRVMVRDEDDQDDYRSPVAPPVAIPTAPLLPIATPNNEYSGALSNNERVVFETTAKNIATMYEKGIITNLSKAICAAYGCTVQSASKVDSTYQQALRAVNKHLTTKGAQFPPLSPEQQATRDALGLDRA